MGRSKQAIPISVLALARYTERNTPAGGALEVSGGLNAFLDKYYDDERMARIYPNAKIVVDGVPRHINDSL